MTLEGEMITRSLPDLAEIWQDLNWTPTSGQFQQFQQFYELVLVGNRQLNLTRITEPEEFLEKHLWDSLRGITPWLSDTHPLASDAPLQPPRIIDIGTGGGFPGVPVAIALPHSSITLLDATRKKLVFLDSLIASMELKNVRTLVGRAEEAGRARLHRSHYDLALIRAVGSASACAEYALPFLKLDGTAVLYRGQWSEEEEATLTADLEILGGAIAHIDAFETPLSHGQRHCIFIRKIAPTSDEFPRPVGVPGRHPLSS